MLILATNDHVPVMVSHTCSASLLLPLSLHTPPSFRLSLYIDRVSRWPRWEGGSGAELSEQQTENNYCILWQLN